LHFHPVNESVTANRVFCPFFGQKTAILIPESPLFRQNESPHIRLAKLRETKKEGRFWDSQPWRQIEFFLARPNSLRKMPTE
jgi:hypothetical protein